MAHTSEYYNWTGYTFESICYKHLSEIRKALQIAAAGVKENRYFYELVDNVMTLDDVFV